MDIRTRLKILKEIGELMQASGLVDSPDYPKLEEFLSSFSKLSLVTLTSLTCGIAEAILEKETCHEKT